MILLFVQDYECIQHGLTYFQIKSNFKSQDILVLSTQCNTNWFFCTACFHIMVAFFDNHLMIFKWVRMSNGLSMSCEENLEVAIVKGCQFWERCVQNIDDLMLAQKIATSFDINVCIFITLNPFKYFHRELLKHGVLVCPTDLSSATKISFKVINT